MFKVAIIGYGNVGFHLAKKASGQYSVFVFTRNHIAASGPEPETVIFDTLDRFEASLFNMVILAVPDKEIQALCRQFDFGNTLVAHVSGSRPLNDLLPHKKHGVMYPLQTFKRDKEVDFNSFPVFIEANNAEALSALGRFVSSLSPDVRHLDSDGRLILHISAVFACNFTNYMYRISDELLAPLNMTFNDIDHLARETLDNALELSPGSAQTGPAARGDNVTIEKHLNALGPGVVKKIYELLSNSIRNSRR